MTAPRVRRDGVPMSPRFAAIAEQWQSFNRQEQQLAIAIYNGLEGFTKTPPFRDLSAEESLPYLEQARAQMEAYDNGGVRG